MPPVVTTKMSPDIAKYLLGSKLQPVKNILLLLFLVAEMVKNLPVIQETWVQSLGQEDPPEKKMTTHSSILAWEIPWTEEPSRLQPKGSQRVGHDLATTPPLPRFSSL